MSQSLGDELERICGARRAGADGVSRALYATDASPFRRRPAGFVRPANLEQALAAAERLRQTGYDLLPRGAGSSLAGQALSHGWILDTRSLTRIGALNDDRIWVEAGVRWGALDAHLAPHGRRLAPNPSSGAWCTLGGMAATNAGGSRSLRGGKMLHRTTALEVLDSRGRRLVLERGKVPDDPFWRSALRIDGSLPAPPVPTAMKNSFGWNLRPVAGPDGDYLDPVALLVGSEGRLATILRVEVETEARLKPVWMLEARPPEGALGETAAACAAGGAAQVEWLGSAAAAAGGLEAVDRIYAIWDEGDVDPGLVQRLQRIGAAVDEVDDPDEIVARIALRKRTLGALQVRDDRRRAVTWIDDPTLPHDRMDGVLAKLVGLTAAWDVPLAGYGHIGDGNLHLRPLIDPDDAATPDRLRQLYEEGYGWVLEAGGSPSGEHGNGLLRAPLLGSHWPLGLAWMHRLKQRLDPHGALPGVDDVDLDTMVAAMRPRAIVIDVPDELAPHQGTALDCHGCGACDDYCPATSAFAEEAGTSRAKAVLVREVLTGQLPLDALTEERAVRAFNLCVDCDACMLDCLSKLPIPRLAEGAKALQPSRRLRDRAIRAPDYLLPVASIGAGVMETPLRKPCLSVAGLDTARRPLPMDRVDPEELPSGPTPDEARGTVVLLPGCATAYQRPNAVRAMASILAELGYHVRPMVGGFCCGAPRLQAGAKAELIERAATVGPRIEALLDTDDAILLTAEATCSHTFRRWDELGFPRIADAVGDLWTILGRHIDPAALPRRDEIIGYHVPCHGRVEGDGERILDLLNRMPGRRADRLVRHCCGMAGSWGMKAEWGEGSRAIGADIPGRVAECDRVVTDCVTCTQQIYDLAETVPAHPVELIWEAWRADRPAVAEG